MAGFLIGKFAAAVRIDLKSILRLEILVGRHRVFKGFAIGGDEVVSFLSLSVLVAKSQNSLAVLTIIELSSRSIGTHSKGVSRHVKARTAVGIYRHSTLCAIEQRLAVLVGKVLAVLRGEFMAKRSIRVVA